MSHYVADLTRPRAPGALRPALDRFWRRVWRALMVWHLRSRQRRALARLDDRLLDDIGVDCRAARAETAKPFWRA